MDTFNWTDLNPDVQFERTKKRFYNKFSTKIVYTIKRFNKISGEQNHNDKTPKEFGHLKNCCLENLLDLIAEIKKIAKVRIESDINHIYVFIFGHVEDLKNIATGLLSPFKQYLHTVSLVSNKKEQELINDGYILLRRPTNFQYRVNMRSGFFSNNNGLNCFLEYANNSPEDIQLTDHLKYRIRSGHKYFSRNYFYIKDLSVLSMIMLIEPTLVKSHQKIKVIQ
jgi:hypothetical protein